MGGRSSLYNLESGANFDDDDSMKMRSSLLVAESMSSAAGLPGSALM